MDLTGMKKNLRHGHEVLGLCHCHGEIAVAMFIHQQFDFRRSQFAMGFNVHLNFFRELCISRHLFWNGYLCIDPRCDYESRLFLLLQLLPCIVPESSL